MAPPGQIATLVLPADTAWDEADGPAPALPRPTPAPVGDEAIAATVHALRSGGRTVLLLRGAVLRERGLRAAGRIAVATGCELLCDTFTARLECGAGLVEVPRIPVLRRADRRPPRRPARPRRRRTARVVLRLSRQAELVHAGRCGDQLPRPSPRGRGRCARSGGRCARRSSNAPRSWPSTASSTPCPMVGTSSRSAAGHRPSPAGARHRSTNRRRAASVRRSCSDGGSPRRALVDRRFDRSGRPARHRRGHRLPRSQGRLPPGRRWRRTRCRRCGRRLASGSTSRR